MLLQMVLFHSFLCLSSILLYTYIFHIFFIHSSVSRHLGCFHTLAIINSAVNIGMHVSFGIRVFSDYMLRGRIAESYNNFIFSFLRNLRIVLHSGCTNLHSTNSIGRFSFLHTLSSICYLYTFKCWPF